jgi:hypothetical protein
VVYILIWDKKKPQINEYSDTMTDIVRIALCKHHTKNPKLTQKELVIWLHQMKNRINKIRVNQMAQTDIRKFFNRS